MAASIEPLLKNRTLLFWWLQIGGWVAYAISQLAGTLFYDSKYENMPGLFKVVAVATAGGFLLTLQLRYLYHRLWHRSPRVTIPVALICCYLFALVWRVMINSAYLKYTKDAMDWEMKSSLEFFSNAMHSSYLLLCWSAIYFGIKYYISLQQQQEATLRAAALAQEAQLKMLRYQLNPHFLFNTLNAISTLILDSENRTANQAVMRLSEFLRYTLDQDPMKKVTVAQEVEALNLYLGIEKMRFGPRLLIEFAIDDSAQDALMPSLLLQPLIENAIKYAVAPREEGGRVAISARVYGGTLHLSIADDGPGMIGSTRSTNGLGVGLRNTRERLDVLYGSRSKVEVANSHPGLRVELYFPAERT
jgi:hypothetical protein